MCKSKKAAFLVYVENQAEFERFLHLINSKGFPYTLVFRSKRETFKSNYIVVDLAGECAYWGGSDLRPFGYYSSKYCSISGGAMNVDNFVEICKLLHASKIPSKEYIVPVNNKILSIICKDGYRILHRPYFAMKGCTHDLYTLHPLSKCGVDAAKVGSANITSEEFLRLCGDYKADVDSYLQQNFTMLQSPVAGFLFITDKGKFVNLAEKGLDFSSLIDELERKNYNVDVDSQRISVLEEQGYIYCNSGAENGYPHYPYLELFKMPTPQQFEAIKLWVANLSNKTKLDVNIRGAQQRFWLDRTPIDRIIKFIKKTANQL